jgi:hypothetical protein
MLQRILDVDLPLLLKHTSNKTTLDRGLEVVAI